MRHRPLGEPEPELAAILLGLAGRVVVHHPAHVLAGRECAWRSRRDACSSRGRARSEISLSAPASAVRRPTAFLPIGSVGEHLLALRVVEVAVLHRVAVGDVDDVDAGVVHDAEVARPDLDAARELVFAERNLLVEVEVRLLRVGLHRPLDRQLEDEVGLAELPAAREGRRRRQVGGVAARRAGADPRDDGVDVLLRQAAVVAHLHAVCGSAPHGGISRATTLSLIDRAHGPRRLVREERHRPDLARPMAAHAVLVEDRRDVLGERGRIGRRRGRRLGRHAGGRHHREEHAPATHQQRTLHVELPRRERPRWPVPVGTATVSTV